MQSLDGVTSGPNRFLRQIGKELANGFANSNQLLNLKSLKLSFL